MARNTSKTLKDRIVEFRLNKHQVRSICKGAKALKLLYLYYICTTQIKRSKQKVT